MRARSARAGEGADGASAARAASGRALLAAKGLSLERLRALVEVADAGGIARAAPGDATRQSQLSRQLGELEAALGVALTERHGRGVQVTAAGREVASAARELGSRLDEIAHARQHDGPRLVVGAGDSVIAWWLLPALARAPGRARVRLVTLSTPDVVERLAVGELDAGLVRRADVPPPLRSRVVGRVEEALFVPRRLARPGASPGEQLAGLPLAVTTGEPGASEHADAVLRRLGVAAGARLSCETYPQAARAVASGAWAGWLPVRAGPEAGEAVMLRTRGLLRPAASLALAWHPRLERRPGALAWLQAALATG